NLLSRPELYELFSDIGFIRIFTVYNDFIYRPLPRPLMWLSRNLSLLLENAPGVRTLAGSILVHTQKPPRLAGRPRVSLFEHEALRRAVSVVIPCHNEDMNIRPMVVRLRTLFGDYLHEIILVDDNSTDSTVDLLRRLAAEDQRVKPVFRTAPNGVGRALRDGYGVATGRYVLSMDCDFQHLLPEIRDMFDAAARGYDVVVGSRALPSMQKQVSSRCSWAAPSKRCRFPGSTGLPTWGFPRFSCSGWEAGIGRCC